MRNLIKALRKVIILGGIVILLGQVVSAQVYVRPYVRHDGTSVQGHYRSSPDNNSYNNYSTKGNVNPYNGNVGTQDPYRSNSYNSPSTTSYGQHRGSGTDNDDADD